MDKIITFRNGDNLRVTQNTVDDLSEAFLNKGIDYAIIKYGNSESIQALININDILYIK